MMFESDRFSLKWCSTHHSLVVIFQVPLVKDMLPQENAETLLICIAATSGIGRVIFGKVLDFPMVNKILLQQVSWIMLGTCATLFLVAPKLTGFEFEFMICLALIMGLFDGCYITSQSPIAFSICGPSGASQAVGFLQGICSIPSTLGPIIAGT